MLVLWAGVAALHAPFTHIPAVVPLAAHRAVRHPFMVDVDEAEAIINGRCEVVPIEYQNPSPSLEPRDVVGTVMAALHRSNWETPTPYYGFEVALRFFASMHQAKLLKAKPAGFARFVQRPHLIKQILWSEYRFEGELVFLTSDDGVKEAYQTISLRSAPTEDWHTSRWKLVQEEYDYGSSVTPPCWLVEHIYVDEPDTPEDIEYMRSKAPKEKEYLDWNGEVVPLESPRQVVDTVMNALRKMDEPYDLHGAVVATRYCSPRNRASELSPQVFAGYLEDTWYSVLKEWEEMEIEEEEDDEDAADSDEATVDIEVLVRRGSEDSFSIVSWVLSLYDGKWLIDSMNIIN